MTLKLLLLPALLLSLSSCAFMKLASGKLKPPAVAYSGYEFKGADERKARVDFILSVYNPNAVGLKGISVDYQLFHQDKRFVQGSGIRVDLPPKDTVKVVIPAEVVYSEVFRVAGPVAERVMLEKKTIPVRIDAVIAGNPTLYNGTEQGSLISFTIKISRTENIPIPNDQIDKAKGRAMESLRKRF